MFRLFALNMHRDACVVLFCTFYNLFMHHDVGGGDDGVRPRANGPKTNWSAVLSHKIISHVSHTYAYRLHFKLLAYASIYMSAISSFVVVVLPI